MPPAQDHYAVLGVDRDASESDIKNAFHTMALKWHPDKCKHNNAQATDMFRKVRLAYEVLRDPVRRSRYEKFGDDDDTSNDDLFHGMPIPEEFISMLFSHLSSMHTHTYTHTHTRIAWSSCVFEQ
eukprot:GHVR01173209.1.p2 GENE.GHVR01173209.1~~GHVR01173209.1.p2  ORF type:complete len:125 (-),score=49.58 GHVR01173209.1:253-627(-)